MSEPRAPVEWDALVSAIDAGDCILMIGPDAITEPVGDRDVPVMRLFLQHLVGQLTIDPAGCSSLSPAQIAQVFKDTKDLWSLRTEARRFFEPRRDTAAAHLIDLAALPFRVVIDTTPVNQMEHAFTLAGKVPIEDWYHRNDAPRPLDPAFDVRRPLVYHVFGSTMDPKSLVLAESDFVDLLVCAISGNPRIPDPLLNSFTTESCMLFLGFGVRHLSLRILLHILNSGRTKNRSFALERFDDDVERLSVENARLFFRQGQRIDFVEMGLTDFARELRERYEANVAKRARSPEPAAPLSRAPLAFLSYCHEDAADARRVSAGLQARGIRIWRDVEDIRTGQRWGPEIERVIGQVDYFIILNSATLSRTHEGFVNTEIKLALKRESTFRGPSYVCPVRIDEAPLIPELAAFHSTDGRASEGLDQLAKQLARDFEARKKTIS